MPLISQSLGVDPVTHELFTGITLDSGQNQVRVINSTTYSLITTINVSAQTGGLAFDPANGFVYVAGAGPSSGPRVSVIDPAKNSEIAEISYGVPCGAMGAGPIAFNPANGLLYASAPCGVAVINSSSNQQVGTISLGFSSFGPFVNGNGYAFDSSNNLLFVGSNKATLYAIDNSSRIVGQISIEGEVGAYLAYDPVNNYLYVTLPGVNSVAVISVT